MTKYPFLKNRLYKNTTNSNIGKASEQKLITTLGKSLSTLVFAIKKQIEWITKSHSLFIARTVFVEGRSFIHHHHQGCLCIKNDGVSNWTGQTATGQVLPKDRPRSPGNSKGFPSTPVIINSSAISKCRRTHGISVTSSANCII